MVSPASSPSEERHVTLFAGEESYRIKLYPIGSLHGRQSSKSPLTYADPSFTHRALIHDDGQNIASEVNMLANDKIWFNRASAQYYRLRSCTVTEWTTSIGMYFVPVFARPVVLVRRTPVSKNYDRVTKYVLVVPSNPEKHRFIPSTDKSLARWWDILTQSSCVRL